jgi:hypothetical protein
MDNMVRCKETRRIKVKSKIIQDEEAILPSVSRIDTPGSIRGMNKEDMGRSTCSRAISTLL